MSRGGNQTSSGMGGIYLLITACVGFAAYLFWGNYKEDAYEAWRYVRLAEVRAVDAVLPGWLEGTLGLQSAWKDVFGKEVPLSSVSEYLASPRYDANTFSFKQFDAALFRSLSWVFAIPLLGMAFWFLKRQDGVAFVFKDADSLLQTQAPFYPHLDGLQEKNPLLSDDFEDAPAVTPHQFVEAEKVPGLQGKRAEMERLVEEAEAAERLTVPKEQLLENEGPIFPRGGEFNVDLATIAFEAQLGGPLHRGQ